MVCSHNTGWSTWRINRLRISPGSVCSWASTLDQTGTRGECIGTFAKEEIDRTELVRLMAGGRELAELEHELEAIKTEV